MEVLLWKNGNTSVFRGGEQIPELQKSYLVLYAEFLKEQGVHLDDVEFTLPSGDKVTVLDSPDGYTWKELHVKRQQCSEKNGH